MFLSLLFLRISDLPSLAQESVPSFLTLDAGNKGPKFDERFNRQIDFTSDDAVFANTQRLAHEYFMCTILITRGGFQNNYAFGAGTSAGSGGAIFCSGCSVSIHPDSSPDESSNSAQNAVFFQANKATVGGALAFLYSSVYIEKIKINENVAYRYGGSIYFQGYENNNQISYFIIQIKNSNFERNACHQIGGAICLTTCYEAYLEGCPFKENRAGISGGAFYIIDSFAKFFLCDFLKNVAGDQSIKILKSEGSIFAPISTGFAGRGGGAIAFISDDPDMEHSPRTLYTQECCFLSNQANNGTSYQGNGGAGHVIIFNGFCAWHSQADYYDNHDQNAIGTVSKFSDTAHYIIKQYDFPNEDACTDQVIISDYTTINIPALSVSFADASSPLSGSTLNVPEPTTFIYQATPLTALPYKTTSSYKTYPTTSKYSPLPNTRTVHATAPASPFSTPATTGTTPEETPFSTPFSTAEETPFSTPFSTAKETPFITPFSTPIDTAFPSVSRSTIPAGIPTYSEIFTSYIYSYTFTMSETFTLSYPTSGGTPIWVISNVNTEIPLYTQGYSSIVVGYQTEMDTEEEKSNLVIIIASVVSGIILIIIIALLIWFFLGYSKSSSSSGSVYEMDEETILHIPDTSSQIISNDNPLWTTSVMGESDDPFRNDFEEVAAEGFFNERAHAIDTDS